MSGDDVLSRAQAEHRAGNAAAAEPLYRAVLAACPDHVEALYAFGVLLAQTGRLTESLDHLERAVGLAPDDSRIGRNFALVLQAAGRLSEAEREFLSLCAREPHQAEHRFGLGLVVSAQGRFADAIGYFREGLALAPGDAEAHCNLGLACRAAGRLDDAVNAFATAAELAPGLAKAHGNLGGALFAAGRWGDAVEAWKKALALDPRHPEVEADLGIALANLGRVDEAIQAFERAVGLDSGNPVFLYNLGRALHDAGRLDEACAVYGRVVALDPGHASAHLNRGVIFRKRADYAEAVAAYDRAIALDSSNPHAHLNRCKALYDMGQLEEAVASCRQAIALKPDLAEAYSELVHLRKQLCDWNGLRDEEDRCRRLVASGAGGVDPFVFLSLDTSPEEQLKCARLWRSDMAGEPAGEGAPGPATLPPAGPGERVRLGYLSADFHEHATAYLACEMFERHDRSQFELFAYSMGPDDGSPMRDRLIRAFDHFVDLGAYSDRDAAARIRDDGIHILVDLKGYTKDARPRIPAQRPAPIQVGFLGYPGSMGADFMDYIIADPVVLPMAAQSGYDERIVHLPHSYQPNDSLRQIAETVPSRPECGLPESGLVFCCFNNTYKITPEVFALWMRLLAAVPGSVLWLLEANAAVRENLRREAAGRGIDPDRLVFAPRRPLAEHLARYRQADLFLDTLPYNAHTTASDALWAGVPVLTCAGNTFAGRVAASLLTAVGLPRLVTRSWEEYERTALELARDPTALAALKAELDRNRRIMPLFDAARFTRNLETAYLRMVERARAGLPPEPFAV